MLPKRERLSVKDIASLSQGRSVFGSLVSLRFLPAKEAKYSVSVSKKVAKRAVDRNRIKRRVYSAVRKAKGASSIPYSVMLMPKRECLTAPLADIQSEIEALFRKALK